MILVSLPFSSILEEIWFCEKTLQEFATGVVDNSWGGERQPVIVTSWNLY